MRADPQTRRQLTPADAEAAADVLARAFAGDPLWRFLLPDERRRPLLVRQSFRSFTPLFIGGQQAYGVGAPLAGVAFWGAPDQPAGAAGGLPIANLLTLLFSPLALAIGRAAPIFERFEQMRRRYAAEPHYYLATIGVVPEAQGRGLASQLIRPILAHADARALPAYTETMTPSNVGLYERFGFVVREQYRVPATDLSIWALYRPRIAG
jgi:ribosomal protein S18 acetylase RimI-like enzyme